MLTFNFLMPSRDLELAFSSNKKFTLFYMRISQLPVKCKKRRLFVMFTFRLLFSQPIKVANSIEATNDDSLINFNPSCRLFEETTSSNITIASLIGSVLRDLEQPSWNEVSTPRSTEREELTAIARRQVQVLQNQEAMSKKLDHIIPLLSAPVANQQAVIHVPPAVRPQANHPPIQEPVPCTMPPAFSPLDGISPPENMPNEPIIPHEELFQIKNRSRSRANFAVLLLKRLFEPTQLEGKNVAGA